MKGGENDQDGEADGIGAIFARQQPACQENIENKVGGGGNSLISDAGRDLAEQVLQYAPLASRTDWKVCSRMERSRRRDQLRM
jgi:hypothetical protein